MVWLIQNSRHCETEAIQFKPDELICASQGAHGALLDFEELNRELLETFRLKYETIAASQAPSAGQPGTDSAEP
jgi:low affinity Fe/Cu permease